MNSLLKLLSLWMIPIVFDLRVLMRHCVASDNITTGIQITDHMCLKPAKRYKVSSFSSKLYTTITGNQNKTFASSCHLQCGDCKDESTCNLPTGYVPMKHCAPGWRGPVCNYPCAQFTYGSGCKWKCGHCRYGEPCHYISGECEHGCSDGWFGFKCEQSCPWRTFGTNCSHRCHCFLNLTCNPETGSCGQHGCALGWKPPSCHISKQCRPGHWGRNCEECGACKPTCKGKECIRACDMYTGICPFGCQYNWQGQRCDVCKGRKYGRRCEHTCGYCYRGYMCHMITGWCGFAGCEPGYMGTRCDLECQTGLYGYQCRHKCSGNCRYGDICLFTNGSCTRGCIEGWSGTRCDKPICKGKMLLNTTLCGMWKNNKECIDGWWGTQCKIECGRCVGYVNCDKATGHCKHGCMGHYIPPLCQECPEGWFGHECDQRCGHCKGSVFCDSITGACPFGCATDFTGHYCQIRITSMADAGQNL